MKYNFNQIKGDILFYRANSILGWLVVLFAKKYSHVSIGLNLYEEADVSLSENGYDVNKINWKRLPTIFTMPFDQMAFDIAVEAVRRGHYGKKQVLSKGFAILTKSWKFLFRKDFDCSEFVAIYLKNHYIFMEAFSRNLLPLKMIKRMGDPSSVTPNYISKVLIKLQYFYKNIRKYDRVKFNG